MGSADEKGIIVRYQQIKVGVSDSWSLLNGEETPDMDRGTVRVTLINSTLQDVWFDNFGIVVERAAGVRVLQEDHYYPFGLAMNGLSYRKEKERENKYKFLGREHQLELGLNWHDLQARQYDPQLGRFHSVDPLVELYQESWTPYHYSFNNPIRFSDPDGRWPGEGFLSDAADFADGVVNAVLSNNTTFTVPTGEVSIIARGSGGGAYTAGQTVGDVVSLVQGTVEFVAGVAGTVGGAAGGVVTSASGVGAVAGAVVTKAGVVVAGHGGSTAMNAAKNLLGDNKGRVYNNSSNNGSSSQPSKPSEAYNRRKHYGTTPTKPSVNKQEHNQTKY